MRRILFVCVHNSGRSQMAEAFGRAMSSGAVELESAGTMPAPEINAVVVEAMREKGIDLAGRKPRLLADEMAAAADRVITMGCSVEEVCPGVTRSAEAWGLDDPAEKSIERVREIRDEIEGRVRALLSVDADEPCHPVAAERKE